MIEPDDLMIPGNAPIHDRFEISAPSPLDQGTAETIAERLTELRSRPVPGAYDSVHLQQIHVRVFQDLFPWAGQFRAPDSSSSLDALFDRLARENRLKGMDPDTWAKRTIEYLAEIEAFEPFIGGTDLASLEFFRELASESNMTLVLSNGDPFREETQSQFPRTQSHNLRRILMLAVDPDRSEAWQRRGQEARKRMEFIAFPDAFL